MRIHRVGQIMPTWAERSTLAAETPSIASVVCKSCIQSCLLPWYYGGRIGMRGMDADQYEPSSCGDTGCAVCAAGGARPARWSDDRGVSGDVAGGGAGCDAGRGA